MRSTHLQAWRLRLPLERPYRLAFGPVEALDTVVVRIDRATLDRLATATAGPAGKSAPRAFLDDGPAAA